jgi:hypothetical protein
MEDAEDNLYINVLPPPAAESAVADADEEEIVEHVDEKCSRYQKQAGRKG